MPRLSVRTVTTWVGPSEDVRACGSATVAIRSRAVRAEPRTRHACTTSRWPRRTKPSASSLDRSAAEPATLRPVLASKTPRSQSPPPLEPRLDEAGRLRRVAVDVDARRAARASASRGSVRSTALAAETVVRSSASAAAAAVSDARAASASTREPTVVLPATATSPRSLRRALPGPPRAADVTPTRGGPAASARPAASAPPGSPTRRRRCRRVRCAPRRRRSPGGRSARARDS